MAAPLVFDVTAQSFQTDVLERSMTQPVLLDFWAEWCAPCRTLLPVLERLVSEYGGAFALGRIDSDREQELAAAFRVQGIPFCILVAGGRPVDGFQGALPEAELRSFLGRAAVEPLAPVEEAEPEDPDSPAGRLARAREAAARGDAASARELLQGIDEEAEERDAADRLLQGLELFEVDLDGDPGGAGQALRQAREALLAGRLDAAMEHALESIERDKGYRGGLGRRVMLLCFALQGEQDEVCDPYRRRLAMLLY